ncbi:HdeD family acid-resistance protein [bacterium]|nr:HdeD family acid-resistance protein [bacterium]
MIYVYTEKWWVSLLRGLIALIIGALALARPIETFNVVLIFFVVYLLLDGLVTGTLAFLHRSVAKQWRVFFVEGFLGLILGLFALIWPGMTALILVYLFAFWALITGLLEILSGIQMRRHMLSGEWLMILTGIVSILLSIVLFFNPRVGAVSLIWILGLFLILFGILQIVMALRLKKYRNDPDFEVTVTEYRSS